MKIPKTVTAAKAAANRKNAQEKVTGPRTAAGKLAASRSGLKHSFYAKELILSKAEKRRSSPRVSG